MMDPGARDKLSGMSESVSQEILDLENVAANMRKTADGIEALALAQGVYSEEMQALVASQREQAAHAEAVAAWGRENGI